MMQITFTKTKVADIKIGERSRKELGDIKGLAESLKQKGLLHAIVISDKKELLAGGRRLAAVKQLKWKEVDTAVVKGADKLSKLEIELIENIQRKDMTWHERSELEARIAAFYTEKDPKWSIRKQAKLLDVSHGAVHRRLQLAEIMKDVPELKQCQTEDEAWKAWKKIEEQIAIEHMSERAAKESGAKKPDGEPVHKWAETHYIVGDALANLPRVNAGTCHFAEVDPPYGINLNEKKRDAKAKTIVRLDEYNEVEGKDYATFIGRTAEEVYRILYKDSFCIWWFGVEWYATILSTLQEVGFKVNVIPAIWIKGETGQTLSPDTSLANTYETFFVCRKGDPKLAKPGRGNSFSAKPVAPARKIHKTEKPIELMVDILETFCYPGSRVLCPFLGSGVTLRACYRKNHVGYGWDLSAEHKKSFLMRVKEDHLLGIKPKPEKAIGE